MVSTREQVREFIGRGLTVRQIAQLLGVSTQAVYKHLKTLDVQPPSRKGADGPAATEDVA